MKIIKTASLLLLLSTLTIISAQKVQKQPEMNVKTLTLSSNLLKTEKKQIKFSPDSMVRRAVYHIYFFDEVEFKKKIGSIAKADGFTVKVQVLKKTTTVKTPDSNMQSPDGGFTYHNYTVKILEVTKNKTIKE